MTKHIFELDKMGRVVSNCAGSLSGLPHLMFVSGVTLAKFYDERIEVNETSCHVRGRFKICIHVKPFFGFLV